MLQLHCKTAAAKEQPFEHQVMQTENTRISISISMSSCTAETHISKYAQRCVGIRFVFLYMRLRFTHRKKMCTYEHTYLDACI